MRREHLWPAGIAAVLAITVGANLWVMRVANADPSFAIEPDYYAQAVAWDSTLAQQQRNRVLGWEIRSALDRDASGAAVLTATVLDASGREIHDARVRVTAFAIARSADRTDVTLDSLTRGYGARLGGVAVPGQWELRFDVQRGGDRMTATRRVELAGR